MKFSKSVSFTAYQLFDPFKMENLKTLKSLPRELDYPFPSQAHNT